MLALNASYEAAVRRNRPQAQGRPSASVRLWSSLKEMKLAAMNERFERLVTAAAAMTTPAKSDDVDVGGGRRRVASRELRVDQTEGESVRLEEWGLSGVCPSRLERLAALNSRYERAVAEVRSARAPALRVVAKSSERESLEVWGLSHTTPCVLARLSNMNHVYNALVRVQKAQWRSAVRLWSNPKQQLVAAVTSPEVIAMPNALVVAAAAAVLDGVPSSDGHDLFFDFSLDALSSEHTEWNDNHNIVKLSVLMPQHKTEFLQQLMAQCDGFFGFLQTHLNFSGSYFPNEREIASRRKAADATWERSRPEARADTIDQQSELCKSALDQHDVDEALSSQSALRMNDNFGLLKLRLSMYARMPIEMCACP